MIPQGSRLPIQLGSIDPIIPMLGSNQPLSPTHVTVTSTNSHAFDKQKDGIQRHLKGPPQLVGLTSLEYSCDERVFSIQNQSLALFENINEQDLSNSYQAQLYEEDHGDANQQIAYHERILQAKREQNYKTEHIQKFPNKSSSQLQQYENWGKIEIIIRLPCEMIIEQIEMGILNNELFKKYLKVLSIERLDDHLHTYKTLQLKGGYIDQQSKIIELNTCGHAQQLKINFLYDKIMTQKDHKANNQGQNIMQQKIQMTSDKIKNEILPLLGGSDDDIDELDDEVAMISNKKEYGVSGRREEISTDDIKITFKDKKPEKSNDTYGRSNKMNNKNHNIREQQPAASQDQPKSNTSDDPENTRNFNTLPRNYSDSQSKNKLNQNGNDIDTQNTKMLIEDTFSNDSCQQQDFDIEAHIFERTSNNKLNENWYSRLITKSIKHIKIMGLNCNQIPAITNMTLLMNNSFYLKKEKLVNDTVEIDFLVGVLMISNKRYTQASEIFRRLQLHYIKQIEQLQKHSKSNGSSPKNNNNKTKESEKDIMNKAEISKLFMKCALLELLVVESMCSATQLNDKLASIKRMIDFFMGKMAPPSQFQQQIFFSEDPYTTMIKILPYLLKFVLMCMTHKKEVIKLAALKLMEFILETKGCSLDQAMVLILKAILKTYPGILLPQTIKNNNNNPHQDSFCVSVISSNVSDYIKSPRQSNDKLNLNEKGNFNNTVNLKLQGLIDKGKGDKNEGLPHTEYSQIKEPNSGFQQALKNAYNHVLDTYISVLSSISSHILHQLFYEVIVSCLTGGNIVNPSQNQQQSQQSLNEIKIFSIKIAEKIITICQGDLILNKHSLDSLLQQIIAKGNSSDQLQSAVKNLWQNIRTKVFANYSLKGMKGLIEWLVEKMTILAQSGQKSLGIENSNKSNGGSDVGKIEITDEEQYQLQQLLDIISLISIGKKKNEEEANNLIKIKQDYCVDLYLLINPLLFWLDFSVEREERLGLFKVIYQTIKDVLENLPPKKVDLDILQIMIPILQKTTEYLKNNSPSLSMLKFLDLVLRDIKQGGFCIKNPDLQYFFLDMLENFVPYISYSLYEEVFSVFDKLLLMCADLINEKVVQKCIVALVDKYTMKSKAHKNSTASFMKSLLEVKVTNYHQSLKDLKYPHSNNNNHQEQEDADLDEDQISIHSKNNIFDKLIDFCFFNNEDPSHQQKQKSPNEVLKHLRNPIDNHDLYIDKLQFFIDTLGLLNEVHVNIFTSMIGDKRFKSTILNLLAKGETQLRLKCHEILEIVTNYYVQYCTSKTVYELAVPTGINDNMGGQKRKNNTQNEVMEVEFINHERLYISQIVVQCVRNSLEQKNDSYLQFNSLILLDFLFQNLLPVPSYQNEYLKGKGVNIGGGSGSAKSNQNQSSEKFGKSPADFIDIETLDINESTPEFEVTDESYLNMRLNLVFKLWPYIQQALNSAWSNIRSICYGLICSMLKVDLRDFQSLSSPSIQTNNNNQSNAVLLKLKQLVLPMLLNLLSSKESESKAGGLNILGSFCGLSYDFSKVKISKNLDFFKKNSNFVSLGIWQLVFDLQDDWDITIKEASVVLIQLCAPRDAVKYFDKVKKEKDNLKFANILNRYAITPGGGGQSSQSSRNNFYQISGASNEEEYVASLGGDKMNNIMGDPTKQNIVSFLSGTDEFSMVHQMEQHLGGTGGIHSDLFDLHSPQQQQQYIQSLKMNSQRNQQKAVSSDDHQKDDFLSKKNNTNLMDYDMQQLLQGSDHHLQNFQDQLMNNLGGNGGRDLDMLADIDGSLETFHFFVDDYTDDQIQEIISIFRNDFKPPKNLWIEKNPSAAFNSPDYYAEIYSQAIDQFNQQQMQLQQQQQQELQQKVSNSPKAGASAGFNQSLKNALGPSSNVSSSGGATVDALEDDLVKKYENEKKEKERINQQKVANDLNPKQKQDNYMIFERHFEDSKEEKGGEPAAKNSAMNIQVNNKDDLGSIDAEPYKFLGGDSPSDSDEFFPHQQQNQQQQQQQLQVEQKINNQPQPNLKIHILDDEAIVTKDFDATIESNEKVDQQAFGNSLKEEKSSQQKQMDSRKTDELIEEYERKINKTIQLLEEEKKKTSNGKVIGKELLEVEGASKIADKEGQPLATTIESNAKSTPEFKQKKDKVKENNNPASSKGDQSFTKNSKKQGQSTQSQHNQQIVIISQQQQQYQQQQQQQLQQSSSQQVQQQAAQYLSELSRGYINNTDNLKLIKQINTVFNDTSISTQFQPNIGPGTQKAKYKLNKSFENVMAAHKSNIKTNGSQEIGGKGSKKNLSSSPRRGSSSGKKIGTSKSSGGGGGGYSKKKYIADSSRHLSNNNNNNNNNNGKALYNMRDLNFFIKTIEKDLSEKFNKMSLKDFNSMPTTPTSILKKVEDQVKALAQRKDQKALMSNTCPNIAQVLGSLDTSQTSKSNQVLQISNIQNMSQNIGSKGGNNSEILGTSVSHTPSSISNTNTNIFGNNHQMHQQQQNSVQQQQNLEKFSFSKTQKIDLNSINKNIFGYQHQMNQKEENSQRDNSSENFGKAFKISPKLEEKQLYTNLLKSSKGAKQGSAHNSKRSRGSQDKYAIGYGTNVIGAMMSSGQSQASGSSSQSKLNKSANMIQTSSQSSHHHNQQNSITNKLVKKQQLSKSFVDSKQQHHQYENNNNNAQQYQSQQNTSTATFAHQQQIFNNNMSPQSQQKKQLPFQQHSSNVGASNSIVNTIHQTPQANYNSHNNNMYTQYSNASSNNMMFDYIHSSEQINKKMMGSGLVHLNNIGNFTTNNTNTSTKTPIKQGIRGSAGGAGGGYQYSEIIEVSPSSGEKEMRTNQRPIY